MERQNSYQNKMDKAPSACYVAFGDGEYTRLASPHTKFPQYSHCPLMLDEGLKRYRGAGVTF